MISLGQATFHHWPPKLDELLSTCKAFIHSLTESCSSVWAGSHLTLLEAMETNAFKIIGISNDEAESMGQSLHHRHQVGGLHLLPTRFWSCTLHPLHVSSPRGTCMTHPVYQQPLQSETAKIQNHCLPPLMCSFFPHCLQSDSSLQVLKTPVHHHLK